jgi:hypothetical protein
MAATDTPDGCDTMKTTLLALTAAVFALFTTTASAATKVGATGCCPFCK